MISLHRSMAVLTAVVLTLSACTSGGDDAVPDGADPTTPAASTDGADVALEPAGEPLPTRSDDAAFIRTVHDEMNRMPAATPIVRGVFSTIYSFWGDRWEYLIDLVATTEINALVIDVKEENGNLLWAMPELPMAVTTGGGDWMSASRDPRPRLRRLHDLGGYAIARVVCMKDNKLAAARPDLTIIDERTGAPLVGNQGEIWMDPYADEVWQYCADAGAQAIGMGFDEVQFDYVRFPNSGDAPVDALRFQNAPAGVTADTVQDPDVITNGLRIAVETVHAAGGRASADVFGLTLYNYEHNVDGTGQVWERLAFLMDYMSPMVYPSHYGTGNFGVDGHPVRYPRETLIGSMEEAQVRSQGLDVGIRPWLEDFGSPWLGAAGMPHSADRVRAQIEATYDRGIESWLLWNAGNTYSVEALEPTLEPRATPWVRDETIVGGAKQRIRQLPIDEHGELIVDEPTPEPSEMGSAAESESPEPSETATEAEDAA